jgi:CBS-domain-containing membrane protein
MKKPMDEIPQEIEIADEDLRAALKEMKAYVDITEEDLKKIYVFAVQHARERLAEKVAVGEIMTREVVAVKSEASLHEVADLLSEYTISGLPVVDEERHVVGIVTEADVLAMAGMKKGHTFRDKLKHILGEPLPVIKKDHTLSAIMTSPAITTTPDTDIRKVAAVLNEKRIKRLPVVDGEGKLIGIISRGDIVKTLGRQ